MESVTLEDESDVPAVSKALFLAEHNLLGNIKNVAKTAKREQLFESKRFKGSDVDSVTELVQAAKISDAPKGTKTEPADEGPPKFTKSILKKGDKTNFPRKGDTTAKKKKQSKPLSFKVGQSDVVVLWDEGLLRMSKGETARLEIEAECVYGKKGLPVSKIPPNAKLIFELELVSID
ncbi:peptidyl-prolyl cis-trans isomerase FKBP3-like [Sinocyclocheilus anshuiensis]|uniref:peptidyl-prolyl cis-trans isomerase FKBP3-like n=1 Tax=Sinocyclocheilus anshuiensis TaxID=1608454 RepID=UPI0007B8DC79|nr:PREDICTED: peptidyl-prolyl cis-trans isomerase FKBP3-like [Sinocyclocheilus anshuiensis]